MKTASGSPNARPSPAVSARGGTRDEAIANIREAIAACLEVRADRGMPLTIETRQVEVAV